VIARVVGPVVDAVPCKSRGVDDEGYSERGSFYAAATVLLLLLLLLFDGREARPGCVPGTR